MMITLASRQASKQALEYPLNSESRALKPLAILANFFPYSSSTAARSLKSPATSSSDFFEDLMVECKISKEFGVRKEVWKLFGVFAIIDLFCATERRRSF